MVSSNGGGLQIFVMCIIGVPPSSELGVYESGLDIS